MIDYKNKLNIGLRIGSYTLKDIKESSQRKGTIIWVLECDCGRVIETTPGLCIGKKPKIGKCVCGAEGNPDDYLSVDKMYIENELVEYDRYSMEVHLRMYRCKLLREAAGDKSIKVDKVWVRKGQSFVDWSIKNGYKPGLSLLRVDDSKPYNKDNCYWGNKSVHWTSESEAINSIDISGIDLSLWSGIDEYRLKRSIRNDNLSKDEIPKVVKVSEKYNLNGGITSKRLQKNIGRNIDDTLNVLDDTIYMIQANNIRHDTIEIRKVQEMLEKAYMLVKMAQEEMEE